MNGSKGITTYSGIVFDPFSPDKDKIKTEDIAHALSLICRANGHSRHFYSVAQHSICCALEAKERNYSTRVQLGALLHDASEAYLSDITLPVKEHLQSFQTIEKDLQSVIYEVYGLGDLTDREIKLIEGIDDAMLAYELSVLLNQTNMQQGELVGKYKLQFEPMEAVKFNFLHLIGNLQDQLK